MTPEQNARVKALRTQDDHVQIFNYVIAHLREQGERSVIRTESAGVGACAYRGHKEDGDTHTMCAIGALITDDEYDYSWEGYPVDQLLETHSLPPDLHEYLTRHEEMLVDLQQFHDVRLGFDRDHSFKKSSEIYLLELRQRWNIP